MLRTSRIGGLAALVAIAALAAAAPSQAKTLISTKVTVPQAVKRTCFAHNVAGATGVVSRSVTAPAFGMISVRLTASSGDWDLGVFDAKTGRTVAGSAHFAAHELAEGVVRKGERLVVQACRVSGRAKTARFSIGFESINTNGVHKSQLVRVSTPTREAKNKLQSLGLDLTEHGGKDFLAVVLHGPKDAEKLGKAGFISVIEIEDLAAQSRRDRRSEAEWARKQAKSESPEAIVGLPSGRTGPYRRTMDYTSEMNALATNYPTIVKKITLPLVSLEGRPVEGLEITTDVNARDGKPVYLQMALHHAREWPSGEHAIEWAYELVCGYSPDPPGGPNLPCPDSNAAPSARVVDLMGKVRTIIIPMVNIDGFNDSREFGEIFTHGGGHTPLVGDDIIAFIREYRRKNCRVYEDGAPPNTSVGNCNAAPAAGLAAVGIDPNRNYGTFWGGPGSSSDANSETFHGPHCTDETVPANPVKGTNCGPFSEPDTENIRRLVSTRHVTTLITNHTYSNLVLRAPGLASQGLAPDELAMKALGDAMAAHNNYTSQYGWQLYDTTGTTEDWSYNTTGGYGYTFEIGPFAFHPPFQNTIFEYDGTAAPGNGTLGNREAFFIAMESTANPVHHSVITGNAPVGAVLRLKKIVQTPTSIRDTNNVPKNFTDTLDTTMVVPTPPSPELAAGPYTWHINPSTRPLVVRDRGRPAIGTPSPPVAFSGTVAGPPADGAVPCANFTSPPPSCTNIHPFTVPVQGGGIDNALVSVQMDWFTPGSDWDMKIFRDTNANGAVDAGEPQVGSSGQSATAFEATSVSEPILVPGQYLVQVINYAAADPYSGTITFFGPDPFQPATTESWTLTCEMPEGTVKQTKMVTIDRGQQQTINLTCTEDPTGVEVAGFAARGIKGGVTVTWRTANESNLAGFNVWRAGKKLNRGLIAAKRAGTVAGASYQLVDRNARAGVTYTYRLQAVTRDGSRSWLRQSSVRAKR